MIFIDRSAVQMPEILDRAKSSVAQEEWREAKAFYSIPLEQRRQRRFQFRLVRDSSVRKALDELFHGKCAYCETSVRASSLTDIELYRPKGGVIGASGEHYPDHYWWLANEWTNLYPACIDCNRPRRQNTDDGPVISGKGGRFPIEDESKRAQLLAGPEELDAEKPLLLDPCKPDVENYLVFGADGHVYSDHIRGQTTIQVLGLNREPLVEARRAHALVISERFSSLMDLVRAAEAQPRIPRNRIESQLRGILEMTQASKPYAALSRQLVAGMMRKIKHHPLVGPLVGAEMLATVQTQVSAMHRKAAKIAFKSFQAVSENFSLEQQRGLEKYLGRDRRIERVEVRNIKPISRLTFKVSGIGGNAPWLMLLGENAAGKSTVLQAIALALIGER
jgi:uncharacterized protein (TIGR02646 family)